MAIEQKRRAIPCSGQSADNAGPPGRGFDGGHVKAERFEFFRHQSRHGAFMARRIDRAGADKGGEKGG